MAITYNAGTNRIVVTGVTIVSFNDIYLADVAGGWGVVTRLCDKFFCFDAYLHIGDATTAGHVNDQKVAVMFKNGVITANGQKAIRVRKGTFTLGGVVSVPDRSTYAGCYLYSANDFYDYYYIDVDNVSDAAMYLYDTFLNHASYGSKARNVRFRQGGGRIWNCLFQECYPSVGDSTNLDIYNLYISYSHYGLRNLQAGFSSDVIVHACDFAISLGAKSHGQTISNGSIIGSGTKAFRCEYTFDQDYHVKNFVIDTWDFQWDVGSAGTIYREYSYNLTVVDRLKAPITTAKVTGNYKTGSAFAETSVDGSGQMAVDKTLIKGYYNLANGDTLVRTEAGFDYTYTEIIVKAPGYETKILRFDPEGASTKEGNVITLEQAQPVRFLDGDPILCLAPESPYHSKILHTRMP